MQSKCKKTRRDFSTLQVYNDRNFRERSRSRRSSSHSRFYGCFTVIVTNHHNHHTSSQSSQIITHHHNHHISLQSSHIITPDLDYASSGLSRSPAQAIDTRTQSRCPRNTEKGDLAMKNSLTGWKVFLSNQRTAVGGSKKELWMV